MRTGYFGALVGAAKRDAPDFIFGDVPAGISKVCFYISADNSRRYTNLESLKTISLATVSSYTYVEQINQYLATNVGNRMRVQRVSDDHALTLSVRKVEVGRADVTADGL